MREVRLAVRTLAKAPLFTSIAVLSLALGIGANTALFSLVDQILLRLLPVRSPRELVQLRIEGGRFGGNNGDGVGTFSHPLYLALRDRNTVFSGLTGQMVTQASLVGEDRNEVVNTWRASSSASVRTIRPCSLRARRRCLRLRSRPGCCPRGARRRSIPSGRCATNNAR